MCRCLFNYLYLCVEGWCTRVNYITICMNIIYLFLKNRAIFECILLFFFAVKIYLIVFLIRVLLHVTLFFFLCLVW